MMHLLLNEEEIELNLSAVFLNVIEYPLYDPIQHIERPTKTNKINKMLSLLIQF